MIIANIIVVMAASRNYGLGGTDAGAFAYVLCQSTKNLFDCEQHQQQQQHRTAVQFGDDGVVQCADFVHRFD